MAFVEDHAEAILLIASKGRIGESYCIGGDSENNKEVVLSICEIMDQIKPNDKPHSSLINYVQDRPGMILDMQLTLIKFIGSLVGGLNLVFLNLKKNCILVFRKLRMV